MDAEDSNAAILRFPWLSELISKPNTVTFVPFCRVPKDDLEDSLLAEILKTPRTIQTCVCFYPSTPESQDHIPEMGVAMAVGDGMNGHPAILHGGITATMLDECCGMYQNENRRRWISILEKRGETAPKDISGFTGELKVRYTAPVITPGPLLVKVRRSKLEGRKEWIRTELVQWQGEGSKGKEVVCAIGEALFILPKLAKL